MARPELPQPKVVEVSTLGPLPQVLYSLALGLRCPHPINIVETGDGYPVVRYGVILNSPQVNAIVPDVVTQGLKHPRLAELGVKVEIPQEKPISVGIFDNRVAVKAHVRAQYTVGTFQPSAAVDANVVYKTEILPDGPPTLVLDEEKTRFEADLIASTALGAIHKLTGTDSLTAIRARLRNPLDLFKKALTYAFDPENSPVIKYNFPGTRFEIKKVNAYVTDEGALCIIVTGQALPLATATA